MIVGERINPTGKKKLQEQLRLGNLEMIIDFAQEQEECGASLLDINVGMSGIDEKEMMLKVLEEVTLASSLPLVLDSSHIDVMEAALRRYPGRALINSVSAEKEKIDKMLPLAKKYGAMVILLPLSDKGLPENIEEKIDIINYLSEKAFSIGLSKEDLIVDGLVATVGANKMAAIETLETIRYCKEELKLPTIVGLSNISFGLPARSVVNAAFLQMALDRGLDLPIMDPGDPEMIRTMDTHALIFGFDPDAKNYIARYTGWTQGEAVKTKSSNSEGNENDLTYLIQNGLEEQTIEKVRNYLNDESPLDVISGRLIPVMDKTGVDFEKGRIFIPQLLTASRTAQKAFDVVKEKIIESGQKGPSKGTVIIATVKGDVHDIGKNIARVVMDNYGYEIIDMGKDITPEEICDKVMETGAKLVGLSALMTTTLPNMEKTVSLIKEKAPDCLIMAGGAVVTEEYVKRIGADFYVEDAQSSARACEKVYGR